MEGEKYSSFQTVSTSIAEVKPNEMTTSRGKIVTGKSCAPADKNANAARNSHLLNTYQRRFNKRRKPIRKICTTETRNSPRGALISISSPGRNAGQGI